MESKLKLGTNVLIVAMMTLITALTWVGLEVYQSARKATILQATQEQMKALNPKINKEILSALKNNLSFSQEELNLEISQPTTKSGILNE